MQQTEKYQFNLIEGSDPFSPEPLNQNMEKVEGALTAHRAEVAAALEAQPKFSVQPYTGDERTTRSFTFPFAPKLVILSPMQPSSTPPLLLARGQKRACYPNGGKFDIIWSGNSITLDLYEGALGVKSMYNEKDDKYLIAAFG